MLSESKFINTAILNSQEFSTFNPGEQSQAQMHMPKELDCAFFASVIRRNKQMQEVNPHMKVGEIQVDVQPQALNAMGSMNEQNMLRSVVQQSQLWQGSLSSFEKLGELFKKRQGLLKKDKLVYCKYKDGIFSIYKDEKRTRASIVLNLYLFNFQYFTREQNRKVVEFGLKCYADEKAFIFSGPECAEWFAVIQRVIKEQRKKARYGYFINPFPQYYKKHLIKNEQFIEQAQSGDVLLFQSKCLTAKAQRMLTQSSYDHVGLVLKYQTGQIYVLEAANEMGVGIFSWDGMLKNGWFQLYTMVVCRQLEIERTPEFLQSLQEFVRESLDKPFRLSLSQLLHNKSTVLPEGSQGKQSSSNNATYFCSKLVAAAYKHVGILRTEQSATQFWPGSFSNESKDLQLTNAKLSDEYLIGFNM